VILLLGAARAAEPTCERWSADGLVAWNDRAQAAIDREDVVGHGAIWRELQASLPCLDGPVPVDAWAELLAGLALVEFAMGYAWEEPLATAIALRPDLSASLPEPLSTFAPPAPGAPGAPLAGEVWIDGARASVEPPVGLHLAQRRADGGWETVLVRGGPLPVGWRADAPAPPSPPAADAPPRRPLSDRAVVSVGVGAVVDTQSASADHRFVPSFVETGPALTAAAHGAWGGPVGAFWDAELPVRPGGGLDADLVAGARIALGRLDLHLGGGVSTARLAIDGAPQVLWLPIPHVGVGAWPAVGPGALDLRVGGGVTPAATGLLARAGYRWSRPASPWIGASAQLHRGSAAEVGGPLALDVSRWTLAVQGGVAFARSPR
jgi:hypothetical protein